MPSENGRRRIQQKTGEPPAVHSLPEQHDRAVARPQEEEPGAAADQDGVVAFDDHRQKEKVSRVFQA